MGFGKRGGEEAFTLKRRMLTDLPLAIEAAVEGKRFLSAPLVEPHR